MNQGKGEGDHEDRYRNRISIETREIKSGASYAMLTRIKELFINKYPRNGSGPRSKIQPSPILILGNQKSGTSAITHLLAEYGAVSRTVDIPEIWWPTLGDLLNGKTRLDDIAKKHPQPFSTRIVKEPNLTFFYDDLSRMYPDASFVFVVRDPRANIRSILNRLSIPGHLKELELDKSGMNEAWKNVFISPVGGLDQDRHYINILATRWNHTADVYLEHAKKIILVRYEDFVADKVGCIGGLAQALGIPQKRDISAKVDIQYQPRGDRKISWLEFFGEENLMRITDVCGGRMEKFGYPVL